MIDELENIKSSLNDLSAAIDEVFKNYKLEEKPVVGWYKYEGEEHYLMHIDPDNDWQVYGFSTIKGKWTRGRYIMQNLDRYSLADPKEVEARLIEEAKHMGFKEGVKADLSTFNINFKKDAVFENNDFKYLLNTNELRLDDMTIFSNGKWAEIIPESEKIEINLTEGVSYKSFAKSVAKVITEDYGTHNALPFIKALVSELDIDE